jgi:hypothetical protein
MGHIARQLKLENGKQRIPNEFSRMAKKDVVLFLRDHKNTFSVSFPSPFFQVIFCENYTSL